MKISKPAQKLYKKSQALLKKGNGSAALSFLKKAAQQGHPSAQFSFGNVLNREGQILGDATKLQEAIGWFQLAAEQGHADAQFNLGHCFQHGSGVLQDDKKAHYWISCAVEQGHIVAQGLLGRNYLKGIGVEKDITNAVHYLTLSAQKGDMYAQNTLGYIYYKPDMVETDPEKAIHWFERAAAQGMPAAQNSLGHIYWRGWNVEQNFETALVWLKKSAEQGYVHAQSRLGFIYGNGGEVEKNLEKAVYWNELASNQGNLIAKHNLGLAYFHGDGVKTNKEIGFALVKSAADGGRPISLFNLGLFYADGLGVKENKKLAFECWLKSAEQGYPTAQHILGQIYARGWHTIEVDTESAIHWLELSAGQENIEAQELLADIQTESADVLQLSNVGYVSNTWLTTMTQAFRLADPELQNEFLNQIKSPVHIFDQTIDYFLNTDENHEIEFKETFSVPTKLDRNGQKLKIEVIRYAGLKEIAGFLNTNDGVLIIGVVDGKNSESKKPEIIGIDQDNFSGDQDKYSRTILDLVESTFGVTAANLVQVSFEIINDQTICRVHCKKSAEPVYCNYKNFGEKPLVRYGSSTVEPPQKEWVRWVNQKF